MATTIIKSIGTSSRDYSTLQLWEDAIPADLTSTDEIWVGECYNDSEFTAGVTISGHTVDATRYIELRCATGHSWSRNGSVRSNAAFYNQSNGMGVNVNITYAACVVVSTNYTRITGLQVQNVDNSAAIGIQVTSGTDNVTIRDCIIYARNPFALASSSGLLIVNTLAIARSGDLCSGTSYADSARMEFCTFTRTSNGGSCGSVAYATLTVENCAIFNFTTSFSTGTAGTVTGGHNCTDLGSAPGSSNQVSKTFSTQFENTTNDFRAKAAGTDLANNGTPATSYATVDATNVSRSATTPWIGFWEYAAAGGSIIPLVMYYKRRRG